MTMTIPETTTSQVLWVYYDVPQPDGTTIEEGFGVPSTITFEDTIARAQKVCDIPDGYNCTLSIKRMHEGRMSKVMIDATIWRLVEERTFYVQYKPASALKEEPPKLKKATPPVDAVPTGAPLTPASERLSSPAPRATSISLMQQDMPETVDEADEDADMVIPDTPDQSEDEAEVEGQDEGLETAVAARVMEKGKGKAQSRTSSRESLAAMADGEHDDHPPIAPGSPRSARESYKPTSPLKTTLSPISAKTRSQSPPPTLHQVTSPTNSPDATRRPVLTSQQSSRQTAPSPPLKGQSEASFDRNRRLSDETQRSASWFVNEEFEIQERNRRSRELQTNSQPSQDHKPTPDTIREASSDEIPGDGQDEAIDEGGSCSAVKPNPAAKKEPTRPQKSSYHPGHMLYVPPSQRKMKRASSRSPEQAQKKSRVRSTSSERHQPIASTSREPYGGPNSPRRLPSVSRSTSAVHLSPPGTTQYHPPPPRTLSLPQLATSAPSPAFAPPPSTQINPSSSQGQTSLLPRPTSKKSKLTAQQKWEIARGEPRPPLPTRTAGQPRKSERWNIWFRLPNETKGPKLDAKFSHGFKGQVKQHHQIFASPGTVGKTFERSLKSVLEDVSRITGWGVGDIELRFEKEIDDGTTEVLSCGGRETVKAEETTLASWGVPLGGMIDVFEVESE